MARWMVLVVLVVAAGCGGPELKGAAWAATYDEPSDDCLEVARDEKLRAIAITMCGFDLNNSPTSFLPIDPAADPIGAALVVANCAAGDQCDLAEPQVAWPVLAAAWDLAMRTDADAVDAALVAAKLRDPMRRDFVARFRAARERVLETVTGLGDHWRDVFLRPVTRARAERAAEDAALADWDGKVDALGAEIDRALIAGTPAVDLVDEALALRRTYVAACRPVRGDLTDCLGDATGTSLSAKIQLLAEARDDRALVRAEGSLAAAIPDRSDPRADEFRAALAAYRAEAAEYARWLELSSKVGDATALAERWPVAPLDTDQLAIWIAPQPRGRGEDELRLYDPNGRTGLVEQVRAVKRKGKRATLVMRRDVHTGVYESDCYDTNRVSSIDENGQVHYHYKCRGTQRITTDETDKPVEVPWDEARSIKAGEIVGVTFDEKTRKGHVVWVAEKPNKKFDRKRDDFASYAARSPQVQWREFRL